jgi:ketosteroid isomerase-like protein
MNDHEAIESAISEFVKAYNSGDITRVLAYYGDDLIKLRNGARLETKSDIARRVSEVFEKFYSRVDVSIDEIQISGDIAFTRGSFQVTLTPKAGGESQTIERRYLEVWQRKGECWLAIRAMDNVG